MRTVPVRLMMRSAEVQRLIESVFRGLSKLSAGRYVLSRTSFHSVAVQRHIRARKMRSYVPALLQWCVYNAYFPAAFFLIRRVKSLRRGKSELCNPAYIVLFYLMMPGSKGLSPHELAHMWADCGSAKHGTIRRHRSWGKSPNLFITDENGRRNYREVR